MNRCALRRLSSHTPIPLLTPSQKYMAEVCPLSCGTCTHTCNDTDASCGAWAMQGECEANPDAMLRICPTSCGLCTPECKDLKEECPGWGAAGESSPPKPYPGWRRSARAHAAG